ncbi:MAG TPA: phosphate uptake regulator PhoU [Thermoplasmatales archaeon]|nr:phosphate uptake regulator PhoU [Thermoplasmatales archaeon]
MEIRKVQVTGGSSYVISLPKTWVKTLNIKKNDPLGLIIQPNGTLLITKKVDEEQGERIIEINADTVDTPTYLFRCLIGAYIAGYTIIKIKSRGVMSPFVRKVTRKFTQATIGQEVVEETDNSITIKDLLNPVEMPFDKSIRRMHLIVKNMHKDAVRILKNRDKTLAEDILSRDNDVDRLHWLIARQHNMVSINVNLARKMGITTEKAANYFLISRIIERVGDHAVRIAKNTLNFIDEKVDKKIIDTIESASNLALEIFDKSIESFAERDINSANKNIDSLTKLVSLCEKINTLTLQQKSAVAISIGYIAESIRRTGEYATDISECVINHLINEKT